MQIREQLIHHLTRRSTEQQFSLILDPQNKMREPLNIISQTKYMFWVQNLFLFNFQESSPSCFRQQWKKIWLPQAQISISKNRKIQPNIKSEGGKTEGQHKLLRIQQRKKGSKKLSRTPRVPAIFKKCNWNHRLMFKLLLESMLLSVLPVQPRKPMHKTQKECNIVTAAIFPTLEFHSTNQKGQVVILLLLVHCNNPLPLQTQGCWI